MKKTTIATNLVGRKVTVDYHCWRPNNGQNGEPMRDIHDAMPAYVHEVQRYNDKVGEIASVYMDEGTPKYEIVMGDGRIISHTDSMFTLVMPTPPSKYWVQEQAPAGNYYDILGFDPRYTESEALAKFKSMNVPKSRLVARHEAILDINVETQP